MNAKYIISILVFLATSLLLSQTSIQISGIAKFPAGTKIQVERFEDYFSRKLILLQTATINADSTFEIRFNLDEIEKIKVSFDRDYCFLYAQPGANYKIAVSNKRLRNFNNPTGNEIEVSLLDLKKLDINYKILSFDLWYDQFMGENYHLRTSRDSSFVKNLLKFEENVGQTYKNESSDFLKTYIKYRVASIEELNFVGSRNERVRYTVNLAPFTVFYRSEEYMLYVRNFYKNFFESLAPELNNSVYKAIVAGSPTRMINTLSKDYRVANVRLRELVMIISLADIYYDKNYPQSRINVILDSISKNGLFPENQIIARNTLHKLKQLNPGTLAPKYQFVDIKNQEINLKTHQPRYTYIQFINTNENECMLQLEMLKNLHSKYSSSVAFVTVVMNETDWSSVTKKIKLETIPWNVVLPKDRLEASEQFQLSNFPSYVLIDSQGHIVQSPAASPIPDGSYKTIDYYFFEIHKTLSKLKN